MSTLEVARLAMQRAERWLESARRAMSDSRWDDAVYSAQMCSEHAAKGVLISLGMEFPKQHDVSDAFAALEDRKDIPFAFRKRVGSISRKLANLAAERALAGYGFEEGVGVEHFEEIAPGAVRDGEYVLESCRMFLSKVFSSESE